MAIDDLQDLIDGQIVAFCPACGGAGANYRFLFLYRRDTARH